MWSIDYVAVDICCRRNKLLKLFWSRKAKRNKPSLSVIKRKLPQYVFYNSMESDSWVSYGQFCDLFCFREDICEICVSLEPTTTRTLCPRSRRLRQHPVNYFTFWKWKNCKSNKYCVRWVNTRISNFTFRYLCENEKVVFSLSTCLHRCPFLPTRH